jgi:hypothetical protein
MAWSASDLKDKIISAMSQVAEPLTALKFQTAFADCLKSYIEDGYQLSGAYVGIMTNPAGITPPTVPDVLTGSYTWDKPTVNITGQLLLDSASVSSEMWKTSLKLQMSMTSFTGSDKNKMVSASLPILSVISNLTINFEPYPDEPTQDWAMLKTATAIIDALASAIPTPPVSPTSSNSPGGTGVTTFLLFSGS